MIFDIVYDDIRLETTVQDSHNAAKAYVRRRYKCGIYGYPTAVRVIPTMGKFSQQCINRKKEFNFGDIS